MAVRIRGYMALYGGVMIEMTANSDFERAYWLHSTY